MLHCQIYQLQYVGSIDPDRGNNSSGSEPISIILGEANNEERLVSLRQAVVVYVGR